MDEFIGIIKLAAFQYAPIGWFLCEGQLLQISQYQALFSLLGTQYGGDGRTTFALPKLNADALQNGLRYIICYQGVYPSRP